MEDQEPQEDETNPRPNRMGGSGSGSGSEKSSDIQRNNHDHQSSAAVRSRWSPKPEQILILESIFNSGMVNPPKDETVRIRKLLEKFGSVGDANVFYWFQNRRSRSRRRQRQIQATTGHLLSADPKQFLTTSSNISSSSISDVAAFHHHHQLVGCSSTSSGSGSGSGCGITLNDELVNDHELLAFPGQIIDHHHQNSPAAAASAFCSTSSSISSINHHHHLHYPSGGMMTVFINGVATEIPRGGVVDVRAMFGQDFVLFHSSGLPVSVNQYGFLLEALHQGQSYFLVHKAA